jgi:hypothetical protein
MSAPLTRQNAHLKGINDRKREVATQARSPAIFPVQAMRVVCVNADRIVPPSAPSGPLQAIDFAKWDDEIPTPIMRRDPAPKPIPRKRSHPRRPRAFPQNLRRSPGWPDGNATAPIDAVKTALTAFKKAWPQITALLYLTDIVLKADDWDRLTGRRCVDSRRTMSVTTTGASASDPVCAYFPSTMLTPIRSARTRRSA